MVKIVTVVGARPQFIKAAPISRAMARTGRTTEVLVHTGQHYDDNMSAVFFHELGIPKPAYDLGIGGLSHGAMTGRILEHLEKVLLAEQPDGVLLYGDTNSTLAGALAAIKLHIPIAHVEAGLRSHNMRMPEEANRIVADRFARLLFCPSQAAADQLAREGIVEGVHVVGDVMYDMALFARDQVCSLAAGPIADVVDTRGRPYVLVTVHRQENTDDRIRLDGILTALETIAADVTVVLPLHPRTRKVVAALGWTQRMAPFRITEPLPYLAMQDLIMGAMVVLTDSGGLQKEAFFHRVPVLTLRDETEWVETVDLGWNKICGADCETILAAWRGLPIQVRDLQAMPYGDGRAAEKIVNLLIESV